MEGLFGIKCPLPRDTEIKTDLASNLFMKYVIEEDRRAKEIRAQEIQLTKENPRIKEANQLKEISQELRELKREEFLKEKRRQQVRDNNIELRQLQMQLQAALVSKQLADQRAKIEAEKKSALKNKQEEDAKLEKERLCTLEAVRQKEIEEHQKKVEFRQILLHQIKENRERTLKEHEEILQDRENMQKLNHQFELDREAERKDLEKRKEILKKEMAENLKRHELMKQSERQDKLNENDHYMDVRRKREEEEHARREKRRLQRERKDADSAKIGQQLFELQNEQRRREDLLLDLLVEERKAKDDLRYRQSLEKQMEERRQLRMELQRYREEILKMKNLGLKEEEEQIHKEQMRIMAERDKLDQMSDQKRRQKIKEYKHALQEMITDKQQQRAEEAAEKLYEYQCLLDYDKKLQKEVEEERIRLLRSQPPDVLRYLSAVAFQGIKKSELGLTSQKEIDNK